ncbi:Rv1733c family protein [Streptomyces sp. NPDC001135]
MRTPRAPGHGPASGSPGESSGGAGVRGPLERAVDRWERRLRVILTVVALVVPPLVAWGAGQAVYGHYTQVRQVQLAQLHPVAARLLTDARSAGDRRRAQPGFHALVRWSDRNGSRTGIAPVRAWLHRGATATVWLDARGVIAVPPENRDFAVTAGVAVGCATAFGGVAAAYGVWRAVDRSIDRRRLAQWNREWERVEPGWVTRYGR